MTRTEAVNKLKQTGIDYDASHITDALAYALWYMRQPEQKSYACECKHCNLTHYTSYKRLNCEYCGCDSDQFTCKELK